MSDKIKLKRDNAANWTSNNPILLQGEPGVELDTLKWKVGDGSTAWNDLLYVSGGASAFTDLTDAPSDYTDQAGKAVAVNDAEDGLEFVDSPGIHAGSATLASGSATVAADWVAANSVITATAQVAPSTPGTNLYIDPTNYVDATSFMISSDDGSDARAVFWIGTTPSSEDLLLPDTFYVSWRARFHQDEIDNDDPSTLFEIGDLGTSNVIWAWAGFYDSGNYKQFFIQLSGGGQAYDLTGIELADATYYTFDLKFVFTGGFATCEVTPRIDGTPLTEGAVTASTGMSTIAGLLCGAGPGSGLNNLNKRDFDWFKIGTGTWGDSDLLDADFSALAPFDSLVGSGISIGSGMLSLDNPSGEEYALKACTT